MRLRTTPVAATGSRPISNASWRSTPSVPTLIFIHGNQITPADAKREGLAVYRRIMRYGSDGPPIRFVIFSWPSSRVGGLLRDVRVKATRTDPAGCQLAWLLDQMPAETPVSLVGFSYGARIITAGLHILAGGHLGHLQLAERDASPTGAVQCRADGGRRCTPIGSAKASTTAWP